MGQFYYLSPQNEQKGPVDASQLVACGVNANTMVWTQGMAQWTPAAQVSELQSLFAQPAPQPAPQAPQPPQSAPQAPQPAYAPQPAAQPAPQSVVYVQTGTNGPSQPMMPKPGNNMLMAVLTTIFCCLPLGIAGIIYASKVDSLYNAGDYAGAVAAAKSARTWCLVGIIGGFVFTLIYLIVYGGAAIASLQGLQGAF